MRWYETSHKLTVQYARIFTRPSWFELRSESSLETGQTASKYRHKRKTQSIKAVAGCGFFWLTDEQVNDDRAGLSQSAALFQLSFLPLFLLSTRLLPFRSSPLPSLPPYQLAVWRKGRHAKIFGWAKSLPPHHLPFSPLYFSPFPFSPLPLSSLRSRPLKYS